MNGLSERGKFRVQIYTFASAGDISVRLSFFVIKIYVVIQSVVNMSTLISACGFQIKVGTSQVLS